jgi:hypothetical protein
LELMFPNNLLDLAQHKNNRFLQDNLLEFLGEIWRATGFLDQPAVTLRMSQNAMPKFFFVKIFRYVKAIEKQEEINFVRIHLGWTLLYLLYIKELQETEKRQECGIKEPGQVKTKAINSLLEGIYATKGQGSPINNKKRTKIRVKFYQQKHFGEH